MIDLEIETENKIDVVCDKYKKIQDSGVEKFKNLDKWLERETNLFLGELKNKKRKYFKYKKGTIIKVDFGINIGSELCYVHFAVVINADDNVGKDSLIVIPLTSKSGIGKVPLNNLIKNEVVKKTKEQLKNKDLSDDDKKEIIRLHNFYKKYSEFSYAFVSQIRTISKSRIIFSNYKFDIINKVKCSSELIDSIDREIFKIIRGINL